MDGKLIKILSKCVATDSGLRRIRRRRDLTVVAAFHLNLTASSSNNSITRYFVIHFSASHCYVDLFLPNSLYLLFTLCFILFAFKNHSYTHFLPLMLQTTNTNTPSFLFCVLHVLYVCDNLTLCLGSLWQPILQRHYRWMVIDGTAQRRVKVNGTDAWQKVGSKRELQHLLL